MKRWRLPIRPKLVPNKLLPGRKVRIDGTGTFVWLPYSVGKHFTLGDITFEVGFSAKPSRPVPTSWLRRLE